jgi:hypothetical protein
MAVGRALGRAELSQKNTVKFTLAYPASEKVCYGIRRIRLNELGGALEKFTPGYVPTRILFRALAQLSLTPSMTGCRTGARQSPVRRLVA